MTHDWHPFDVERELEVRRTTDTWQLRDATGAVTDLTDAEFEGILGPEATEILERTEANPNPDRITEALWKVWLESAAVIPGVRLGGIYAFKPGYHSTVSDNRSNWPNDYSIRLSLDTVSPTDKARAIDLTMSTSEMRRRTGYLREAAERRDPRLRAVREFYGTVDGNNVFGRIKDGETGAWRWSTSDDSHLWHIHISIFTAFCDDSAALSGVVSVLTAGSSEQGDDVIGLRLGDENDRVVALQGCLRNAGYDPGAIDGVYGKATSAAVLAMRKAEGTSVTSGDRFTGTAYYQLMTQMAKNIGRGAAEPDPR
jgi:hypothetical protein